MLKADAAVNSNTATPFWHIDQRRWRCGLWHLASKGTVVTVLVPCWTEQSHQCRESTPKIGVYAYSLGESWEPSDSLPDFWELCYGAQPLTIIKNRIHL